MSKFLITKCLTHKVLYFELFRAYVDLPASLPHKYDVIFDDGRARVPCAQSALRYHGLINYLDSKAKCRHLKELTCKGTLRQVLIRVYRLEWQSVIPALWTVGPIPFSLVQLSPPPPKFPVHGNKNCILYTRIQCVTGRGGVIGFWTSNR